MKKNKIAFYGASLVQQRNGFWKLFSEKYPNLEVRPFGFGARHLNDAGICYIDDVLDFEPDYCIIDWFTTGYVKYNEHKFEEIKTYINTIVHKFFHNNIPLLFLILPDETCDKKDIYKKIHAYLDSIQVPVLNLSTSFENTNEILRDGIHTTDYGSEVYAKLVGEFFFSKVFAKYKIPKEYPAWNKFCEIKRLEINKIIYKRLVLTGDCEVIGISQLVGPYTGMLNIDGNVVNYWDRWCYYEREMVNMNFPVNGKCTIEILEDDFERALKHVNGEGEQTDWSVKKCLKLFTIFYIGGNLEVESFK